MSVSEIPTDGRRFPLEQCLLAPNQQLIWMGQQQHPTVPLYEMIHSYRIKGNVDLQRFSRAFEHFVAQHEILRIVAADQNWSTAVAVDSTSTFLQCHDLSTCPDQAETLIAAHCERPLDPTESLFDSLFLRLGSAESRWIIRLHHILTDGGNSRALLQAVSANYQAVDVGFSGPATQFEFDHSPARKQIEEQHAAWWHERSTAVTPRRFYARHPSEPNTRHQRRTIDLTPEENGWIEHLCHEKPFRQFSNMLSVFNVFATVFSVLLYRLEETTNRIVFGTPSHGRTAAHRDTVGLLMQLLPFRINVEDSSTFADVSRSVAVEKRGFLQHSVPGVTSTELMKSFDVVLNVVDFAAGDFNGWQTTADWRHNGFGDEHRRLALTAHPSQETGRWQLLFDFNESSFTEGDQKRLIEHFKAVLSHLAADPNQSISSFEILTRTEEEFLDKHSGLPRRSFEASVWRAFEDVAARTPDHAAILGEGSISFSELYEAANILAADITSTSDGRLLPVVCRRDQNAIVAFLGVLAAEKCFLPIDADLPRQRIELLLRESGASHYIDASTLSLLSTNHHGDNLLDYAGACYVLYTSGSTGTPNGVVVGHDSLINLLQHVEDLAPVSEGCRAAWWTNVGFDVAIYEVFSALLYGRTLCIPSDQIRNRPAELFDWFVKHDVGSVYLPPFFLSEFNRFTERQSCDHLERLLVGVEPIPQSTLAGISRRCPGLRIINGYGPTETTVCATMRLIDDTDNSSEPAAIGAPVAGNTVKVVDSSGNRVPLGSAGELLVSGIGVARGYLSNVELTRSRFRKDPETDECWYYTGDQVRFRPDGNLDFLGRFDSQLKIRGQRIEAGEVQTAIADICKSSDCAVFSFENSRGVKELAAVVRSDNFDSISLRRSLRERLPDSLVPGRIVASNSALPRTQNGKPDIASLTRMVNEHQPTTDYESPATDVEKEIHEVWRTVLDHDEFGVTQSFFEVGGDSLLAMNVVGALEELGFEIATSDLFRQPTVRDLATHIRRPALDDRLGQPAVGVGDRNVGRYRLTPSQESIWAFEQLNPASPAYNVQLRIRLPYLLDETRLRAAVQTLVERHEVLRSSVAVYDGEPWFSVSADTVVSLNVERLSDDAAVERIQRESSAPFDLTAVAPLLRVLLIEIPDGCWLVLTGHHLAIDQHSCHVLLEELAELYTGRSLSAPGRQASDFARWKRRRIGNRQQVCRAYWQETVDQCRCVPMKPRQHRGHPDGFVTRRFSAGISRQLKDVASKLNVTMHNLLLSAFQVLQFRYHGESRFIVGLPVAQRNHFRNTVGYLMETVPFPCSVIADGSFAELAQQTENRFLDAIDHLDMPLAEVTNHLKESAEDASDALINTMFVMHQRLAIGFDGEEDQIVEVSSGGEAKFDLTLFVSEDADEFHCGFEYRGDVFARHEIDRVADQWQRLLRSIGADFEKSVRALEILTPAEIAAHSYINRDNRLNAYESQKAQADVPWRITDLFDHVVANHPDSVAAFSDGNRVTYHELDSRANEIASVLRGKVSGGVVGLCCDRSLEMLAGLMGILKAGYAYTPIDPALPSERLRRMLDSSGVTTVFTSPHTAGLFETLGVATITETDHSALTESQAGSSCDDLAYVIYTSGSTGEPNGVEVSHSALIASTQARFDYYDSQPSSFLLLSPVWFDSSVAGIFWTLCSGGTLVLPTNSQRENVQELGNLIHKESVSHTLCIPSFYQLLLDHADPDNLATFNTVIVAGEECQQRLAQEHHAIVPGARLFNEYGPTEASVWASVAELTNAESTHSRPSIGHAAPGCEIRILNDAQLPVPAGVVGEVYIGGARLANGYRDNSNLTAERFVALDGSRFYRTGDLACIGANGDLEFRGRRDDQLKIHGQRIERGEVEAALLQCPDVQEVAVGLASDSADSAEELSERLTALPTLEQQRLIDQVLSTSDIEDADNGNSDREMHTASDETFSVQVEIQRDGAIAAPRDRQRKWLLDQVTAETISELNHLNSIAPKFVAGDVRPHAPADLSQRRMSEQDIMEDWQTPMMKAMADYTCQPGDNVLEIGFGRGVAASFIQERNVSSHTIIEMNPHSIADFFNPWRDRFADRDVRLIEGRWQDSLPQLDTYDAIFFHAFPMSEQEFLDYIVNSVTFAEHFFPVAAGLLRDGGCFTYMSTEIDSLSRRHQRSLFDHFDEVHMKPQKLNVPEDTRDAWWANSMVVVRAIKGKGESQ